MTKTMQDIVERYETAQALKLAYIKQLQTKWEREDG